MGVEALLRWQHPKFGNVVPDKFIPIAEDNNTINPIGAWVINKAFMQLKAWKEQAILPDEFKLAINLSPKQRVDGSQLLSAIQQPLPDAGFLF